MKIAAMRALSAMALLLGSAPCAAHPAEARPTLIRQANVFDGERTLGTRDVLIGNGRILAIGLHIKPPANARIVDGAGKTLLPGLIDAHVHAYAGLDAPLLFGVTTQLDMFMLPEAARATKARMAAGTNTDSADLYTAGYLATVPGGHGTEYGMPVPTIARPEEAEAWVQARIAEGSDYIKLIEEPGTAFHQTLPTLDFATMRAIIAAAHRHGKLAVVHAEDEHSAEQAINAGADGLMHLFHDRDGGRAFAELAHAHHVFVTPTYVVFEAFSTRAGSAAMLRDTDFGQYLPKEARDMIMHSGGSVPAGQLDAVMRANITALRDAKVPILAGTDSGNPGTWYGLSLHRELQLLVQAGLTPAEALTAATAASARAFRLADRGRIAPGLKADLLLVDGDPAQNIVATRKIVEVWKDGVSANPLREQARAKAAAADREAAATPLATLPADGRIGVATTTGGSKATLAAPVGVWMPTTDALAGGKSTVAFTPGTGTPDGQPSLLLSGALNPGFAFPWAGIFYQPGDKPFTPVNLAAVKRIVFRARGMGSFALFGFSTATGRRPVVVPFGVSNDWSEISIPIAQLSGFDPGQTQGIAIVASGAQGPFQIEIADIRLLDH